MADQRSAFLGEKADAFRFHRPGFEHVPGSVSLESAAHPGLYLRYKNYKFHLEKMKPSGVFGKTLIEKQVRAANMCALSNTHHNSRSSKVIQYSVVREGFLFGCSVLLRIVSDHSFILHNNKNSTKKKVC